MKSTYFHRIVRKINSSHSLQLINHLKMGISKNNDLYYAPSYLYKLTRTLPPQNNLFDLKKKKEHYNALQTKKITL